MTPKILQFCFLTVTRIFSNNKQIPNISGTMHFDFEVAMCGSMNPAFGNELEYISHSAKTVYGASFRGSLTYSAVPIVTTEKFGAKSNYIFYITGK